MRSGPSQGSSVAGKALGAQLRQGFSFAGTLAGFEVWKAWQVPGVATRAARVRMDAGAGRDRAAGPGARRL